ncbi:MAG: hypothetical protein A3F24_01365 [Candidatus Colwellbacteria bacterium RIFCSPHIGHO2_12_FULL_44_17]|uniref:Uncharacterized protein n=3 Tax=Candidatus Colwelliibacteriota TaxID=1817904 RepID=A0A1G1Z5J2_9BACT|nr:MAG: hypothetical protein A3F24_01365 [Candidatus Colwellbacteria bacterium RIFCSPHIGHO2_12_FULL_44_17]OGY59911.1 MAG: hypothetical protein A3I31_02020 [Candidatus Colwellbacteria bacterium RIFCSPLOWO2_02_FULL_44_20b]
MLLCKFPKGRSLYKLIDKLEPVLISNALCMQNPFEQRPLFVWLESIWFKFKKWLFGTTSIPERPTVSYKTKNHGTVKAWIVGERNNSNDVFLQFVDRPHVVVKRKRYNPCLLWPNTATA